MESKPDYSAFCPVVNRPDLLRNVVNATQPLWSELTIIDNSPERWVINQQFDASISIYASPVPFTFSQTMNFELGETVRRGDRFCVHMHNDAIIPEHACECLLEYVRDLSTKRPRWAVVYTLYDVLAVYNPKVYQDIGGYDTNLPNYFSDNDWYRRLELAGWERINSGIEVGHVGSQTINSDAYLKHVNSVMFPLYRQYYFAKWGGFPGEEKFIYPFGVLPKEWALANASLTVR